MAGFDPLMRRETWVFQEIGRDGRGPIYQLCDFLYVSYDDSPTRFIEPWANGEIMCTDGPNAFCLIDPANRQTDPTALKGYGRVVGFEFVTNRPYEVHSFNDNDFTGIGTLPPILPGTGTRSFDT